jgi:hypothetical protein
MKPRFRITYEIIGNGGCEPQYRGFMPRTLGDPPRRNHMPKTPALFTLRQAFEFMQQHLGHIEADESPVSNPRWFTVYPDAHTGGYPRDDNYSLHVDWYGPSSPGISRASRMRIARLLNCHGIHRP